MRSNGISIVSPADSILTASASAAVKRPVKFLRPSIGCCGPDPGLMTDEPGEVLGLDQWTVEPWRGDLEGVVAEQVADLQGDALAELEADAVGMVDVEPQGLARR